MAVKAEVKDYGVVHLLILLLQPQDRTLPYYRDVLIPKGWTDADWTGIHVFVSVCDRCLSGLPPSESAVASEQKKEEASLAKYAFNAYKSNK